MTHKYNKTIKMIRENINNTIIIAFFIVGILHYSELMANETKTLNLQNNAAQLNLYNNNTEQYRKAWILLDNGEIEKANEIIQNYFVETDIDEGWKVLLSSIYYNQGKYEKALTILSPVAQRIIKAYDLFINKKVQISEDDMINLKFHYDKVLLISGLSNYYLDNWSDALKFFFAYSAEQEDASVYEFIGMCNYKINELDKAIHYFTRAYNLHENSELKSASAYNIGALNAILGDVDEAVKWLKIPLRYNQIEYIEKIINDEDFDSIRNNIKFKEFIKLYE